jgi:hypothetical protein
MNEEVKDELNEELNEEIEETEAEFEAEEITEEETEEAPEEDVELEYDDEGNIVIPEDSQEEIAEEENNEEAKEEPKNDKSALDEKDAEIARLKKLLESNDMQLRDTLKSLGVDEKDGISALEKLAAEAEDTPIEEYRKKKAERIEKEEAAKTLRELKAAETKRSDLSAIHTAYPETTKYKSVEEFPNFAKFGQYRILGLPPEEAYIASHSKVVISNAVESAKQQTRNLSNTKNHLRSNVPVGSRDRSITITKREMSEYKEMFPNLSDKEIVALYKQTNKK